MFLSFINLMMKWLLFMLIHFRMMFFNLMRMLYFLCLIFLLKQTRSLINDFVIHIMKMMIFYLCKLWLLIFLSFLMMSIMRMGMIFLIKEIGFLVFLNYMIMSVMRMWMNFLKKMIRLLIFLGFLMMSVMRMRTWLFLLLNELWMFIVLCLLMMSIVRMVINFSSVNRLRLFLYMSFLVKEMLLFFEFFWMMMFWLHMLKFMHVRFYLVVIKHFVVMFLGHIMMIRLRRKTLNVMLLHSIWLYCRVFLRGSDRLNCYWFLWSWSFFHKSISFWSFGHVLFTSRRISLKRIR